MRYRRFIFTAALAGSSMLALASAQAQNGSPTGTGSPSGLPGLPGETTTPMQPRPFPGSAGASGTGSTRTSPSDTGTTRTSPDTGTTRTSPDTDTTRTSPDTGTTRTSPDTGTTRTPGTEGSSGTTTPGTGDTSGTGGGTSSDTDTNVDLDLPAPPPAEPYPTVEPGVVVTPAPMATAPVQPIAPETATAPRRTMFNRIGGAVLVGGGVEDFTNNNLQAMTGVGGYWNARAVAGTHQIVGLEAAYVGAARSIDALGLSSNAALVSNGVEGALRLNAPILGDRFLFEPFGFVGVGWSHYNVTNTNTASSDVNDKDDVMTLPYGGGLEYSYGALIADARFTYRYTYRNDLMRTSGGRLNNWSVGGQLGVAF